MVTTYLCGVIGQPAHCMQLHCSTLLQCCASRYWPLSGMCMAQWWKTQWYKMIVLKGQMVWDIIPFQTAGGRVLTNPVLLVVLVYWLDFCSRVAICHSVYQEKKILITRYLYGAMSLARSEVLHTLGKLSSMYKIYVWKRHFCVYHCDSTTANVVFVCISFRHQLEVPGRYRQLQAFWEDKKATLPPSASSASSVNLQVPSPASTPSSDILPELRVWHGLVPLSVSMQRGSFL